MTPLTVAEARAILRADEALDVTWSARESSGNILSADESDAWIHLVASANDRVTAWGKGPAIPRTHVLVLVCREESSWVAQAIVEDVASQGATMLDAVADLGRMFDARDHLLASDPEIASNPRAPVEYERAFSVGHPVGDLPRGLRRAAQVSFGISPFERVRS